MSAIEEARKLESEFTTAYISLRQEAEANYQRIQTLLARGNPTPEEVQVVNDAASQLNERIQSTVQPLIRQLGVVEREVGFFDRSAFREITQRIQQEIANFGQFATQSRTARESLNKLSTENQAATAKATADKASADQGPQTSSAGGEVTASGNTTQAPAAPGQQQAANGSVTTASTTTQPSNAEKFAAPGTTTVQPSVPTLPGNVVAGNASTAGSGPVVGASINTGTGSAREAAPLPALAPLPYKAVTVVSSFERGRFTQELEGVLLIFTKPPERVIPGTEDLSYQSTPKVETEGAPPAATQPSKLPNTPVSQQPNASNLAQQPTSTPGEPVPAAESTDTLAPAETAPATSASEPVAAPPANQPPPFKTPGGYVTQIPPGVTQDPNSGAWIYRDAAGEEVMFTASTNEALAARVKAYDTGENVRYVDYDRNSGWVYETFDPNTQTRNIVGPAPNPYEQSAGTAAPSQNMAREN